MPRPAPRRAARLPFFALILALFGAATPPAFANSAPAAETGAAHAQLVLSRYRDLLLPRSTAGANHHASHTAALETWISALDSDGAWPDIDYTSDARGAWPTLNHLERVRTLARALVDPSSPMHGAPRLEQAALLALDHWTRHRYQNPNWWQNRIGVPLVMRDIVVLLRPRLSDTRFRDALAVIDQVVVRKAGDGANTIWTADIALVAAALRGDPAGIAFAAERIAGEIGVGKTEGIQTDFSFHQHGPRLQQFHYGGAFLRDTVRVAWLLRDTPWAFPPETVRLLADYLLEGGRWMSRGKHTVPGTIDRAVSRVGGLGAARLSSEPAMLADLLPARRQELENFHRLHVAAAAPVLGFRHFPRSDFTAYHRPAFSFFLKTLSPRTLPTESINRENLRGGRLGWGDHYLLTNRSHYDGLPPVWDWDQLPGVTATRDARRLRPPHFSGALGDGRSGFVAMDYTLDDANDTHALHARKLWALHRDLAIALIGDLTRTAAAEPVRTALDQRRLAGPVTLGTARGETRTLPEGSHHIDDVAWLHHDGFAYLPLRASTLTLSLGPVTGSWRDINLNQPARPVTLPVFLPVLEHGHAPRSAASGFVLASAPTPEDAAALAATPAWEVLRNDAGCQALRFADGTLMAAFYRPGRLEAADKTLEVDRPCLLMLGRSHLRACDPTQQGFALRARVNGREMLVDCPPGGLGSASVGLQ